MITIETLVVRLGRTSEREVESWIDRAWLRGQEEQGEYRFDAFDEARARLILELRHDLGVEEETLPVVLSLLDQLYAARRQMRLMATALSGCGLESAPETEKLAVRELQSALKDCFSRLGR